MDEILKVLVVDDDEVDRMAVQRALSRADVQLELFEATNCAQAIQILKSLPMDCVFLDYRLPDQDGLALIRLIRSLEILSPLVVLTGQGDEQIAVDMMKAGATDYLSKSKISPGRLAQILLNAIRVYRAEQEAILANRRLQESYELLIQQNKELQQQRQRIYAQNLKLIEASKLKSRFLATISHELRTPLNAIIGFSQILLRPSKGPLTPKQVEMVERIFNNGKHLLSLLTEVLDFSRIEAGHLDLSPQSFCLEDLVEDTIEELRSLAEQKRLQLFMQSSLESSMIINDPSRVRQILVNLISNAIKFTEVGQVWVEIKEIAPEKIKIGVHDTGIGIASHQIDFIFEAFRQADQSETRKHPGTGLGLAITQTLVQLMEGEITLSSELGQGSTFWITIPRVVGSVCLSPDSALLSTEAVM